MKFLNINPMLLFRMRVYAVFMTVLTGCGADAVDWIREKISPGHDIPSHYIDPAFEEAIESFREDAAIWGADVSGFDYLLRVEFGDPQGDKNPIAAGLCQTHYRGNEISYTVITIHEAFRDRTDTLSFKALMYHELGHCVLQKEHASMDPHVIMSPQLASEAYFFLNWDPLVKYFFTSEF